MRTPTRMQIGDDRELAGRAPVSKARPGIEEERMRLGVHDHRQPLPDVQGREREVSGRPLHRLREQKWYEEHGRQTQAHGSGMRAASAPITSRIDSPIEGVGK